MTQQEAIELLIKLKGKDDAAEMAKELENVKKALEDVDTSAKKAEKSVENFASKSEAAKAALVQFGTTVLTNLVDEETGLPSAEGAIKGVSKAFDGLIDSAPALAAALGQPQFAVPLSFLTGALKGAKDGVIEFVEELMGSGKATDEATEKIERYAKELGKTTEEVKELMKVEEERKKRQEASREKVGKILTPEQIDAQQQVRNAVAQVGGKQALKDVTDALTDIYQRPYKGMQETPFVKAQREEAAEKARREAGSTLDFAQGNRGTIEEQERARKILKNTIVNNAPQFAISDLGFALTQDSPAEAKRKQEQARLDQKQRQEAEAAQEAQRKQNRDIDLKMANSDFRAVYGQIGQNITDYKDEQKEKQKADAERDREMKKQDAERRRAEAETQKQAKQLGRDRPDLVAGTLQSLFEGGGSDQAVDRAGSNLRRQGVEPNVASTFVAQQLEELRNKFATKMNANGGDAAAANLSLMQEIMSLFEDLIQKNNPIYQEQQALRERINTNRQTLQQNGR